MDASSTYGFAVAAITSSIKALDIPRLRDTLQSFPVLQILACNHLTQNLTRLANVSESSPLLHKFVDAIDYIVEPLGRVGAEGKWCAKKLVHEIHAYDVGILWLVIKQMHSTKQHGEGCGQFVNLALRVILARCRDIPEEMVTLADRESQVPANLTSAWNAVFKKLATARSRQTDVLDAAKQSSVAFSGIRKRNRSLRLELDNANHVRIAGRRIYRTAKSVCPDVHTSVRKAECELLFKLATLYTVCPSYVSERIRAHRLTSYCSERLVECCKAFPMKRGSFSAEELHAIETIGRSQFASSAEALKDSSTAPYLHHHEGGFSFSTEEPARAQQKEGPKGFVNLKNSATEQSCIREQQVSSGDKDADIQLNGEKGENRKGAPDACCLLKSLKGWMVPFVGAERLIEAFESGKCDLEDLLSTWELTDQHMTLVMDDVIIKALAHNHGLVNAVSSLFGTKSAENGRGTEDGQKMLVGIANVSRMLGDAVSRSATVEPDYWEQIWKIQTILEWALAWIGLHQSRDSGLHPEMKRIVRYFQKLHKRMCGHMLVGAKRPTNNDAILCVCECLSVKLMWLEKDEVRRRSRKQCGCETANEVRMMLPRPDVWFSWIAHTCRRFAQDVSGAHGKKRRGVSESMWIYRNAQWRDKKYCYSNAEIVYGIIYGFVCSVYSAWKKASVPDDDAEFQERVGDLLKVILVEQELQIDIVSGLNVCARKALEILRRRENGQGAEGRLRLVRGRIEAMWKILEESEDSKRDTRDSESVNVSETLVSHAESLLETMAPSLKDVQDCIEDMPSVCKHMARCGLVHLRSAPEATLDAAVRVKIMTGLLRRSVDVDQDEERGSFATEKTLADSVVGCFL